MGFRLSQSVLVIVNWLTTPRRRARTFFKKSCQPIVLIVFQQKGVTITFLFVTFFFIFHILQFLENKRGNRLHATM